MNEEGDDGKAFITIKQSERNEIQQVTRHTSHVTRHTSHVTRHTSHVTRHTSHVKTSYFTLHTERRHRGEPVSEQQKSDSIHHTSHVTRHTSHVTRHMSHVTRHMSHVTCHTSHVTCHTSHVTRHTSHVTRHTSHVTFPSNNSKLAPPPVLTCDILSSTPNCCAAVAVSPPTNNK
jgi:hypothetical protein